MRLILVRHGQTDYNLHHRYQGQLDIPLNQTGLEQANKLVNRLSKDQIDAIYASDLARCVQTIELVAKARKLDIQKDARWRELSFGNWEGMSYQEIRSAFSELLEKWQTDPARVSPPNGETLYQLAKRVKSALDEINSKHGEQTVLLCTHNGPIRVLLCLALNMDLNRYWQFGIASASISEVSFYDDGAIVNLLNLVE